MGERDRPARPFRSVENCWIPMPDGVRLAARLWIPVGAEASPVPAILEYIPYRKRDRTRFRDEPIHAFFAGHGYAAVRVDLRGSGDSQGLLLDEYLPQEMDDGVEVIRWIAAQPWCSGSVGMMGKSWGGFNALQVAARAPEALRGILVVCASDDRYADDAHYMGGCLLNENLLWGSVLLTLAALPPDPEIVGAGWREEWHHRLEHLPLYPETWMRHPRRDAYWRQGSVREAYDRIRCPVYAVGGWADAYTNAIPRLLAGLSVPRRGLIGPWAHRYPHQGVPGPAIGFLQEAVRFWDHCLRGVEKGFLDEPLLRTWMPGGDGRGRWVAETGWPSDRLEPRRWFLHAGRLSRRPGATEPWTHTSSPSVGAASGSWCSFGDDLPGDQAEDDLRSLTFDGEPLPSPLEILGAPVVSLSLAVDRPRAFVAVRLCDVAPDGASTRVTYGLLDLRHRAGHDDPQPLEAGARLDAAVRLNDVAHRFPAGHRIRLAVSTSYWPIAWPSPEPVVLTLFPGGSSLELPVRPPRAGDDELRRFDAPAAAPEPDHTELHEGGDERITWRDPATGEVVHEVRTDTTGPDGIALVHLHDIDLEFGHGVVQLYRIRDDDPLSAVAEIRHRNVRRRGDWSVRVESTARLTADRDAFRLEASVRAFEGEAEAFVRSWDRRIPRD